MWERLAAIRARNLARYSAESRAELTDAQARYNWRIRGPMIVALVVVGIAQTTPTPVRITGDVLALVAIGVSFVYMGLHNREMKKARRALRASRLAYEAAHPPEKV